MIEAIIFDFGNVIAKFDNSLFIKRISKHTKKSASELNSLIYKESKLPSKYEQGGLSSNEFFDQVVDLCELSIDIKTFRNYYTNVFTPIPKMVDLVNKLRYKYKLGLLSSTSEWDYKYGIQQIINTSIFDVVTLTYELQLKKPNKKLYKHSLNKMKVKPQETIYIDDLPKTIDMANKLDINGILYKNHIELLNSLNRLGVKV